ncbi:hypothetical protein [Phytohabitans rumicis]|nr:hypothetical protein [Phytohabitans rumicis]
MVACGRTDHEQSTAVGDYICWRNHHATSNHLRLNSKIRHLDHLTKAA